MTFGAGNDGWLFAGRAAFGMTGGLRTAAAAVPPSAAASGQDLFRHGFFRR